MGFGLIGYGIYEGWDEHPEPDEDPPGPGPGTGTTPREPSCYDKGYEMCIFETQTYEEALADALWGTSAAYRQKLQPFPAKATECQYNPLMGPPRGTHTEYWLGNKIQFSIICCPCCTSSRSEKWDCRESHVTYRYR